MRKGYLVLMLVLFGMASLTLFPFRALGWSSSFVDHPQPNRTLAGGMLGPRLGCGRPPAEPARTNLAAGHFLVRLFYDQINGLTVVPSNAITITVERGGSPVASLQTASDNCGSYNLQIGTPDNHQIFLPGSTVKVQETGLSPVSYVLPDVEARVNQRTNLVSGQALPSQTIFARWCEYDCTNWLSIPTSAGGDFALDFTSIMDITRYGEGTLEYDDALSGESVQVVMVPGQVTARLQNRWVSGYTGAAGISLPAIRLRLLAGTSSLVDIPAIQVRSDGWFSQNLGTLQLTGELLELSSPTLETVTMTIPTLTMFLNPLTDTVRGSGPANTRIDFEFHSAGNLYLSAALIGPDGTYDLDLAGWPDLQVGDPGVARLVLPDLNRAETSSRISDLRFLPAIQRTSP